MAHGLATSTLVGGMIFPVRIQDLEVIFAPTILVSTERNFSRFAYFYSAKVNQRGKRFLMHGLEALPVQT